MPKLMDRLKHGWNVFINPQDTVESTSFLTDVSYGSMRPGRVQRFITGEKTIISSVYTRMSLDVASNHIRHVRLDEQERYLEEIDSQLNRCFKLKANKDQFAQAFLQDVVLTMFDKGHVVVVPIDTTINPKLPGSWDIETVRAGYVVDWRPDKVKINVYNDRSGKREEVLVDKTYAAIVENPFYGVMNEPNSTLQRILKKLSLLDVVDEQSSSGKLDIIIQLPYMIKSDARRAQAEKRRQDIEFQLKGSQYGIAYTDGTEKITQLNRPAENNLMAEVEYLVNMLYSQLGITDAVLNGTADERTMRNYYNRTIEPILVAITQAFRATFLTKTALTQRQSIEYYLDLFTLVPLSEIAEIADKFTRNEIASSNEIRQIIRLAPRKDPKADELRNSNMPQSELGTSSPRKELSDKPTDNDGKK